MDIIRTAFAWCVVVLATFSVSFGLSQTITPRVQADTLHFDEQEATVRAIKRAIPGVVSINIFDPSTPENPQKTNRGSGSGFIISSNGLIITNKHVVSAGSEKSQYKVTLYSGKQYYAQLIGKDPLNDLAVLKIYDDKLPFLEMGDSNKLSIGMTVIAIGNALGRYDHSATKGIISGLARNLSAATYDETEDLKNVIQTDAEINLGNSGGPLINLEGKVVGVNVAKDSGGQSIGFSIPINEVKPIIESVRTSERIRRAYLGLRFFMITPELADEKQLVRTTGALITPGDEEGEVAIVPGSPADKAGLIENDIIFEVDGRALDERLPLSSIVNQFTPGKKIGLKIQRGQEIFTKIVTLEEYR
ncbi:MAG TPA: trypsin-like peptidase domain-containing protein [bacterium]|nr:trypsin-like peptidase domain-containing protein [bacterium]